MARIGGGYRQAGILQMGLLSERLRACGFHRYETEIYDQAKASLDRNPVKIRWQALMKTVLRSAG